MTDADEFVMPAWDACRFALASTRTTVWTSFSFTLGLPVNIELVALLVK